MLGKWQQISKTAIKFSKVRPFLCYLLSLSNRLSFFSFQSNGIMKPTKVPSSVFALSTDRSSKPVESVIQAFR